MDPITTKIATTVGGALAKKVFNSMFPDQLAETRVELALETATQAWEMAKKLDGRADEEVMRTLADRIADPAVIGFARLLFEAAVDATTDERRKMLSAALAGGALLDFGAEMRSRVARALITLEPSDVQLLRRVANAANQEAAGKLALAAELSAQALAQALCIERGSGNVFVGAAGGQPQAMRRLDLASVTEVGRQSLRMLDGWAESPGQP